MTGSSLVLIHGLAPGVAQLTLNRPEVRNALNRALLADMTASLAALADDAHLRCLIVTGAGTDAFCAGADLTERLALTADERTAHTDAINAVADALEAFPTPVIAAVHGYALAGGAELAIACDVRLVSEHAVFGFPEVGIGIFPGAGGPVRLPRLVGAAAARELLFTGRRLDAQEAVRLGLVREVVPVERLEPAALNLARTIAGQAPLAVRALKRALVESEGRPSAEAHRVVARHRRALDTTADYAEGLRAFAERRPPRFKGE